MLLMCWNFNPDLVPMSKMFGCPRFSQLRNGRRCCGFGGILHLFPKSWGYPQSSSIFYRIVHHKPFLFGVHPDFGKAPVVDRWQDCQMVKKVETFWGKHASFGTLLGRWTKRAGILLSFFWFFGNIALILLGETKGYLSKLQHYDFYEMT